MAAPSGLWHLVQGSPAGWAGLVSAVSSWPAHSFFLRLCSEVPILEDTLMRILVIGLSRELPLGPADAMELADHLVKRAAAVQADGVCPWGVSWPVVTAVCHLAASWAPLGSAPCAHCAVCNSPCSLNQLRCNPVKLASLSPDPLSSCSHCLTEACWSLLPSVWRCVRPLLALWVPGLNPVPGCPLNGLWPLRCRCGSAEGGEGPAARRRAEPVHLPPPGEHPAAPGVRRWSPTPVSQASSTPALSLPSTATRPQLTCCLPVPQDSCRIGWSLNCTDAALAWTTSRH